MPYFKHDCDLDLSLGSYLASNGDRWDLYLSDHTLEGYVLLARWSDEPSHNLSFNPQWSGRFAVDAGWFRRIDWPMGEAYQRALHMALIPPCG